HHARGHAASALSDPVGDGRLADRAGDVRQDPRIRRALDGEVRVGRPGSAGLPRRHRGHEDVDVRDGRPAVARPRRARRRAGRLHGFLGPNGAGTTTTIRVLLGLMRADGGRAGLLGGDPWSDATKLHKRLAYVPGDVTLWPSLTGGEVIDLLGRLRGGLDP